MLILWVRLGTVWIFKNQLPGKNTLKFRLYIKLKTLYLSFFMALMALLICGQASGVAEGSPASSGQYSEAKKSFYGLVNSQAKTSQRKNWLPVIREFEEIFKKYPESAEAPKASFTVGRLYHRMGKALGNLADLEVASQYYRELIKNYSSNSLSDDALIYLADIYLQKKNYSGAQDVYLDIIENFASGDQFTKAKSRLRKIQTRMRKDRLVIDRRKPLGKAIAVKPKGKVDSVQLQALKKRKGIPLIVVDAGHGGKDYGAKGHSGLWEKHLNLTLAKRLKEILEKRYKYSVWLTRDVDTFIALKDRGEMANKIDADLFVSIHANAAERRSAKGFETYYLGTASSERAIATAARENGDLVHSVADDVVQEILASLISTTKINDSSRLAAKVQNKMSKTLTRKFSGARSLGVKEGPFFVLHQTNMPSILVEVGFVTNADEEKRLKSKNYQNWLAESIARGIHEFLKEKAPSI